MFKIIGKLSLYLGVIMSDLKMLEKYVILYKQWTN